MELIKEISGNAHLYVPVVFVAVSLVLVYVFGFKRAVQPPFDKLSAGAGDERKSSGKKRKVKDKKTANGHVANLAGGKNEKSPAKDKRQSPAPTKPAKKQESVAPKPAEKPKKSDVKVKKNETIEEIKNKKNAKKLLNEKPLDYDDGNWETVPSKLDKKKKQESPVKKETKKAKKSEKLVEIEKLVKEEVNKVLREKDKIKAEVSNKEEASPVVEKKKEKKTKDNEKQEVKPLKVQKTEQQVPKKPAEPPKKVESESDGGVAFDELGDVWKEAKVPKKSKKKTRRDN